MPKHHRVAVAYFHSRAEADDAWTMLVDQGVDAATMRIEPAARNGVTACELHLTLPPASERRLLDALLVGSAIRLEIHDARDTLDGD